MGADSGLARGSTEHHDAPGEWPGHHQTGPEGRSADRFQHQIDATGSAGDLVGKIRATAVEDVAGTESVENVVLRGRGGRDDLGAVMGGKPHGSLPDATRGGVNAHHLAGSSTAEGLQCRQSRDPVQHQADRLGITPPEGDGKCGIGWHHHVLREGAGSGTDDVSADRKGVLDAGPTAPPLPGVFSLR